MCKGYGRGGTTLMPVEGLMSCHVMSSESASVDVVECEIVLLEFEWRMYYTLVIPLYLSWSCMFLWSLRHVDTSAFRDTCLFDDHDSIAILVDVLGLGLLLMRRICRAKRSLSVATHSSQTPKRTQHSVGLMSGFDRNECVHVSPPLAPS